MCVVSAVIDHHHDYWPKAPWETPVVPWKLPDVLPPAPTVPEKLPFELPKLPATPTQQSIDELIRLLKEAAAYDRKTNQPDCEKPELIKWLQELLNKFDAHQRKVEEILEKHVPKKKKRTVRKKK